MSEEEETPIPEDTFLTPQQGDYCPACEQYYDESGKCGCAEEKDRDNDDTR